MRFRWISGTKARSSVFGQIITRFQGGLNPYAECVNVESRNFEITKVLIVSLLFLYTATICLVWSHLAWLLLLGCLALTIGVAALLRRKHVRRRLIENEGRESMIQRLGETLQYETERLKSEVSSPD